MHKTRPLDHSSTAPPPPPPMPYDTHKEPPPPTREARLRSTTRRHHRGAINPGGGGSVAALAFRRRRRWKGKRTERRTGLYIYGRPASAAFSLSYACRRCNYYPSRRPAYNHRWSTPHTVRRVNQRQPTRQYNTIIFCLSVRRKRRFLLDFFFSRHVRTCDRFPAECNHYTLLVQY